MWRIRRGAGTQPRNHYELDIEGRGAGEFYSAPHLPQTSLTGQPASDCEVESRMPHSLAAPIMVLIWGEQTLKSRHAGRWLTL